MKQKIIIKIVLFIFNKFLSFTLSFRRFPSLKVRKYKYKNENFLVDVVRI